MRTICDLKNYISCHKYVSYQLQVNISKPLGINRRGTTDKGRYFLYVDYSASEQERTREDFCFCFGGLAQEAYLRLHFLHILSFISLYNLQ